MKLTDEQLEKQAIHANIIIPIIAKYIEERANEFYTNKEEKRDFVLTIAVNLLGNLAMQWSENTVESKLLTSTCTIENLMSWYGVAIKDFAEQMNREYH